MAARGSVWAASRSSPRVCDAITARRSREVPSGTVGGRMAWAKTPRSSAASHTDMARCGVADDERHDLGLRAGDLEALAGQLGAQRVGVGLELVHPAGLLAQELERGQRAATAGGGSAVEKISERAVLMRYCAISRRRPT